MALARAARASALWPEACRARGYEYCLITDHSATLYVAHGLDAERLAAQRVAIDALNAEYEAAGLAYRVLAGTEADILSDGKVDMNYLQIMRDPALRQKPLQVSPDQVARTFTVKPSQVCTQEKINESVPA